MGPPCAHRQEHRQREGAAADDDDEDDHLEEKIGKERWGCSGFEGEEQKTSRWLGSWESLVDQGRERKVLRSHDDHHPHPSPRPL